MMAVSYRRISLKIEGKVLTKSRHGKSEQALIGRFITQNDYSSDHGLERRTTHIKSRVSSQADKRHEPTRRPMENPTGACGFSLRVPEHSMGQFQHCPIGQKERRFVVCSG